jgi:hypothetical protein
MRRKISQQGKAGRHLGGGRQNRRGCDCQVFGVPGLDWTNALRSTSGSSPGNRWLRRNSRALRPTRNRQRFLGVLVFRVSLDPSCCSAKAMLSAEKGRGTRGQGGRDGRTQVLAENGPQSLGCGAVAGPRTMRQANAPDRDWLRAQAKGW